MQLWFVIALVAFLLIALAASAQLWLPGLLTFVSANTDLIQGLESLAQIGLWVFAAIMGSLALILRSRHIPTQAQSRDSSPNETGHVDTGGGAYVRGDVSAGKDFVGRDQKNVSGDKTVIGRNDGIIAKNVQITMSTTNDKGPYSSDDGVTKEQSQAATRAYFQALADRHRYLDLKGMGVSDRVPLRLPLLDLFVPLNARLELPEGEAAKQHLYLAGRPAAQEEQAEIAVRLSEPRSVLNLLRENSGLILLGDPGAGKTTFLKYLTLKIALGDAEPLGLENRLPILAPLSAYANKLDEGEVSLHGFLVDYYHAIGAEAGIADMLTEAFTQGAALVLLDGLDEVKDPNLRHTVVKRVEDFYAFQRGKGNKFVITSRIVGYREVRPCGEGLAECTLVDFSEDEIEEFVTKWTMALEQQASGETAAARKAAERERRELLAAIQGNPGVRHLAANPLLLTILALMKRQGVDLPERRVQLYETYVQTLLSSWNRARGLGRAPSRDVDVVRTVKVLAPLALWMHEANPGVGLVKREALRAELKAIYAKRGEKDAEAAMERFLEDVREHAGLLLERGPGEYGFIHLTFEEYLTAVAVAQKGQSDTQPIVDYLAACIGSPEWREVILLTVGYLGIVQQREEAAGAVVEGLIEYRGAKRGEATVLAGEAVIDARPEGVPPTSEQRVIGALVETMQDSDVDAPLRWRAGLALGQLGWLPEDLNAFIEILAGPFLYGDDKEQCEIVNGYRIARYPVTNAQYARFAEAGGYDEQQWWSDEGWSWRDGSNDSEASETLKDWLAGRPAENRTEPFFWSQDLWNNPLCPVVGVTWFEAEAYCRWLTSQLHDSGAIESGARVRLPSEQEWERAARAEDGRDYPWRGEFDRRFANTALSELGATTAVCTYPGGVSPSGVWDMSGNVWEWTLSLWSAEDDARVGRGGSWFNEQRHARCAVRVRDFSGYYNLSFGFRVVVSLANSGS